MYVIDSATILAASLLNQEAVSLKELKLLASKVRRALPKFLVDLSHQAISTAIEDYPNAFHRLDDFTIARGPTIDAKFVDLFFVQSLPEESRAKFLNCFN
ncbi:hypothetical protein M0R72_09475 [Candidatus Pacearchaeota archaeon]|jgi:hypothetical protein|nr:hypothetical protein [Candidatus Pacearchaeota archaeon]